MCATACEALSQAPVASTVSLLPLLIGVATAVWLHIDATRQTTSVSGERFTVLEHDVRLSLSNVIAANTHTTAVLAGFFSSRCGAEGRNGERDRVEFNSFAQPFFDGTNQLSLQAVEYVPHLQSEQQRLAWEADASAWTGANVTVKAASQASRPADSGPYFPVGFLWPLEGNEAALMFDLGSSAPRAAAMALAATQNMTVASAPIRLVQGAPGSLVFQPVYNCSHRQSVLSGNAGVPIPSHEDGRVAGFVLTVYRVRHLIAAAARAVLVGNKHAWLEVRDDTDVLYTAGGGSTDDVSDAGIMVPTAVHEARWTVPFANRHWEVSLTTARQLSSNDEEERTWLVVIVPLVASTVLTFIPLASIVIMFRQSVRLTRAAIRATEQTHQYLLDYVCHEVRNPLHVGLAHVDLAVSELQQLRADTSSCDLVSGGLRDLEIAQAALEQVAAVMKDVTGSHARGSKGHSGDHTPTDMAAAVRLHCAPAADVCTIMRDVANQYRSVVDDRVTMFLKLPSEAHPAIIDQRKLRQIAEFGVHRAVCATTFGYVGLSATVVPPMAFPGLGGIAGSVLGASSTSPAMFPSMGVVSGSRSSSLDGSCIAAPRECEWFLMVVVSSTKLSPADGAWAKQQGVDACERLGDDTFNYLVQAVNRAVTQLDRSCESPSLRGIAPRTRRRSSSGRHAAPHVVTQERHAVKSHSLASMVKQQLRDHVGSRAPRGVCAAMVAEMGGVLMLDAPRHRTQARFWCAVPLRHESSPGVCQPALSLHLGTVPQRSAPASTTSSQFSHASVVEEGDGPFSPSHGAGTLPRNSQRRAAVFATAVVSSGGDSMQCDDITEALSPSRSRSSRAVASPARVNAPTSPTLGVEAVAVDMAHTGFNEDTAGNTTHGVVPGVDAHASAGGNMGCDGATAARSPTQAPSSLAAAARTTEAAGVAGVGDRATRTTPSDVVAVVDDERLIRKTTARFLQRAGIPHILFSDGQELLSALLGSASGSKASLRSASDSAMFGVILLDIVMRGSNGVHVCSKLRAAGITTPVYAMTANADPASCEVYRKAGFDGVLAKPFSRADLCHAVAEGKQLGRRRQHPTPLTP